MGGIMALLHINRSTYFSGTLLAIYGYLPACFSSFIYAEYPSKNCHLLSTN